MTTPNIFGLTTIKPITQPGAFVGTTDGALYTVGASKAAKVSTAALTNTTGAAVTVSISLVRSGGSAGDTNRFVKAYSLAANDSLPLGDYLGGGFLNEGDFVSAIASATGVAWHCCNFG